MGHGRQIKTFGLLRILAAIRQFGFATLAREAIYRTVNAACERYFGVRTAGKVELQSLGLSNEDWHEYAPVGYWAIASSLLKVPLALRDIGFLDIGSGKGRPLVVAAALGIRRIVGVEIARELNEIARANLAHVKACDIEVVDTDAAKYCIPADVNVLFLANSFKGPTLESVLANIRRSHAAWPRSIYLVVFNDRIFDSHASRHDWIRRIRTMRYYPGFDCGIYHVSSSRRLTCD